MATLSGSTLSAKLLETKEMQERLKRIKLLALDVDGVMTDGKIFWLESQGWTRSFNIKDGYGLKLLMAAGIQIAIISGGKSKDVEMRAQFLKVHHTFLGDENKIVALDKILATTGFKPEEIAFVGDDLFDIPVLERVGFSATVPHAVDPVKERVHYITQFEGGNGAVREVADAIRKAQGHGPY